MGRVSCLYRKLVEMPITRPSLDLDTFGSGGRSSNLSIAYDIFCSRDTENLFRSFVDHTFRKLQVFVPVYFKLFSTTNGHKKRNEPNYFF